MTARCLIRTCVALILLSIVAVPAFAVPPPNDNCATPLAISGNGLFPFDNTMATISFWGQNNPNCLASGLMEIDADLWYCWTAPCTGTVTITTCGLTTVDTKIAFYNNNCVCPTTTALCCNDDFCGFQTSINCEVVCGQKYMIQLGMKTNTPAGTGQFSIQCNGQPCLCDNCCGKTPDFLTNSGAGTGGFTGGVAVVTQQSGILGRVVDYVDVGAPQPLNTMINWNATFFTPSGPQDWSDTNLGTVFGVTLDELGNTYLTHSSSYDAFFASGDAIGTITGGAAGAIYKIDTTTGIPSTFAVLPNNMISACSGSECWPGLGNICFSCQHHNLYVSNFEDGRIYRLNTAGTILSTWKHATGLAAAYSGPDPNDGNGFSPKGPHPTTTRGQRVWAVQTSKGRLYYSVWREDWSFYSASFANEIWSVGLLPSGDFMPGTEVLEISMPPYQPNISSPVSDISFRPNTCCMLVAERSMSDDTTASAHVSRLMEFCKNNGVWSPSGITTDIGCAFAPDSSAGGCDYDFHTGAGVLYNIWGTGDAIKCGTLPVPDPYIYGLGAMSFAGTNPFANGVMIDSNQQTAFGDKMQQGDVEITCPTTPTVCDVDSNGLGCTGGCIDPPTGYECVPVEIKVEADGQTWHVTNCDCIPMGHCHISFDPLAGATCVGTCPTGDPCTLKTIHNTDNSTTYFCACEPLPACEPDPQGLTCMGSCPTPPPGYECVPVEITRDMNGNWTITDCNCQPIGECHVDLVQSQFPTCVGSCPIIGMQCTLRSVAKIDGSVSYRCTCGDPEPTCQLKSVCDPDNPGTCDPACVGTCPPGFICIPTEIREFPVGSHNYNVSMCDCVPVGQEVCHPIVMNGLLSCKGGCSSGKPCKLVRVLEPPMPPSDEFGARYHCECSCVHPPAGMVNWWPMDDNPAVFPINDIAALLNHGTPSGGVVPATAAQSCVGGALFFNGASGVVTVPNASGPFDLNFGISNFTLEGWMQANTPIGQFLPLLDKRVFQAPSTVRGYAMYVTGGKLGFQLGDGTWMNFVANALPSINNGVCHHVAVTVTRGSPNVITLYVDGASQSFNDNTIFGPVNNNAALLFGTRYPILVLQDYYVGSLDEWEFFRRALTPAEITALYGAGALGKCRETAYAPDVNFCNNHLNRPVCFQICNYTNTPQTYNWTLTGPSGGAGCANVGAVVFTPASGTSAVIPPFQCQTICATMARPPGLTIFNTGCYTLTVTNTSTSNTFTSIGHITASQKNCFECPPPCNPTTIEVGTARELAMLVTNETDGDGVVDYTIRTQYASTDIPDDVALGLNGLPPGEPVIGTLVISPGQSMMIPIAVEAVAHEPFDLTRVVLEADADGDGTIDDVSSLLVRTQIPCFTGPVGDLDGDGLQGSGDVAPFVEALLGMPADPYDYILADVNCDGHADGDDIGPFVNAHISAGP